MSVSVFSTSHAKWDWQFSVDYKCPTCKKRYRRLGPATSCCVQHPRGECCHAFEVRVTKKGWVKG